MNYKIIYLISGYTPKPFNFLLQNKMACEEQFFPRTVSPSSSFVFSRSISLQHVINSSSASEVFSSGVETTSSRTQCRDGALRG